MSAREDYILKDIELFNSSDKESVASNDDEKFNEYEDKPKKKSILIDISETQSIDKNDNDTEKNNNDTKKNIGDTNESGHAGDNNHLDINEDDVDDCVSDLE